MKLLIGSALFLAAALGSGCSLLIDSSTNGLKCSITMANGTTQKLCAPGSSCRGEDCIADGTVKDGESCTEDKQCDTATSSFCPSGISICGKRCTKIYDINSDCPNGGICAPVPDDKLQGKFSGGVCLASECNTGDSAAADKSCTEIGGKVTRPGPANRCVRVTANGGLCLPVCTVGKRVIDVPTGGKDQCTTDQRKNPQHCGRLLSGDFVCLPVGAAKDNAKCTLFPLSAGAASEDACDIGQPGLPLVCINAKGSADPALGELRCRRSACDPTPGSMDSCPQTPTAQICDEKLSLKFCKGPTE